MVARITVTTTIPDARANGYLKTLKAIFPTISLEGVSVTDAYTIEAKVSKRDCEIVAKQLTNPLVEKYSTDSVLAPESYSYAIEIGYLPGVTDNVGNTARQTGEDCLGRKFKEGEAVYSSRFIFLNGDLTLQDAKAVERELHNPLIERATVFSGAQTEFPIVVPKVKLARAGARADEGDLNVGDISLEKLGKEGIQDAGGKRRGPLSLSLRAMKVIREHFAKLGRNPTDVELESLAQTWSEHCKHTIFADPLDDIQEGIYRRYIKGATQKIRKQKGRKDFCVSVFTDNSGGIAFDDKYLVTHKDE